MRWCCSCHCYASENHFGLLLFQNIFLLINSVHRAFLSLHRAVLFKHLGPFSLSSFPHLALDFSYFFQLFISFSFYSLFLSHLTMVSVHTVFSTFPFFCSRCLWPRVCTCAVSPSFLPSLHLFRWRTSTSSCSILIPLQLHCPHFFLKKKNPTQTRL